MAANFLAFDDLWLVTCKSVVTFFASPHTDSWAVVALVYVSFRYSHCYHVAWWLLCLTAHPKSPTIRAEQGLRKRVGRFSRNILDGMNFKCNKTFRVPRSKYELLLLISWRLNRGDLTIHHSSKNIASGVEHKKLLIEISWSEKSSAVGVASCLSTFEASARNLIKIFPRDSFWAQKSARKKR